MTEYARTPKLVSIVVTNYNKASYLRDCLDGILRQTYRRWELILVDDSSTDESLAVASRWQEDNAHLLSDRNALTFLGLPRNVGYAGALTLGMYLSKGEYIAVHDADDVSHPDRLGRQVEYLKSHPEIELLGTNYAVFDQEPLEPLQKAGWIRYGEDIPQIYANGGHCVCQGTALLRGSLFDRTGGLSRRVTGAEDYDFISTRLTTHPRNVENLRDVLYYYRKHPAQRSRKYFGKDKEGAGTAAASVEMEHEYESDGYGRGDDGA
ncbi:glycosyltransferase family 2 protein [Cohnella suwonensis]|uniref:Glycosyltransferase family 2 protein n=1 Tax=Cohnella suwonensis TaxID=696072 RepID=A0ABW0LVH7_9BACL